MGGGGEGVGGSGVVACVRWGEGVRVVGGEGGVERGRCGDLVIIWRDGSSGLQSSEDEDLRGLFALTWYIIMVEVLQNFVHKIQIYVQL